MKKANKILLGISSIALVATSAMGLMACGKEKDEYVHVSTFNEFKEEVVKGGKIKLDSDIEMSESLVVTKDVVLDLNGKAITEKVTSSDPSTYSLFYVRNGDKTMTVTGNGSITSDDNRIFQVGSTGDSETTGKIVIENGSFTTDTTVVLLVTKGSAYVNGGTYKAGEIYNNKYYTLNILDSANTNGTGTIEVSGGKFWNFNPAESKAETPTKNLLKGGDQTNLKSEKDNENYYVVSAR